MHAIKNSPMLSIAQRSPDKNFACILNHGDDALLLRAHLLKTAQKRVFIQTFIWKNDESGRYMAYLLYLAARRGVQVKVLVDCWPGLEYPPLLVFLSVVHPNIEVKFYNPLNNRISPSYLDVAAEAYQDFDGLNHRMHNKSFIVDGSVLIIGGRNYENTYYDRSKTRNFKDREVAVLSGCVKDAEASFAYYFESELARAPRELDDFAAEREKIPYSMHPSIEDFKLNEMFKEIEERCGDEKCINEKFIKQLHEVDAVDFISDDPCLEHGAKSCAFERFKDVVSGAKREVFLQTPYFVLSDEMIELFSELSDRETPVRIKVSTNSLAATDNVLAYATSYQDRARHIKKFRLEVFEIRPLPEDWQHMVGHTVLDKDEIARSHESQGLLSAPPYELFHLCLHAKTYVIDDEVTVIGSANIDPRSVSYNSENGVIIRDRAFTKIVKADMLRDAAPQNSWAIGLLKDTLGEELEQTECFVGNGTKSASCFSPDFIKYYQSVGAFPQANGTLRQYEASLKGLAAEFIKPLV